MFTSDVQKKLLETKQHTNIIVIVKFDQKYVLRISFVQFFVTIGQTFVFSRKVYNFLSTL